MDPSIINESHKHVFQLYKELKQTLPKSFFKIKILKSQKYPLEQENLLNKIENDFQNDIQKNFHLSPSLKNININIYNKIHKNSIIKTKNKNKTNRIIREKTLEMEEFPYDTKTKRIKGLYNSCSVNDMNMKNNLYLPRIIDRMRFGVPRNLRNNNKFMLLGHNMKDMLGQYKNIQYVKNSKPTDINFYFSQRGKKCVSNEGNKINKLNK